VIARPLPARTPEEVARLVRALGSHRYVAGRLLLVHAFVLDALAGEGAPGVPAIEELREALLWAKDTLSNADIDPDSRDERLWRRATERELAAALEILWSSEEAGQSARSRLARHLDSIDALPEDDEPATPLFDEDVEDDMFPILVDAGWELLPLAALDPERHRGAIEAFGDKLAFDSARFEEESAGDGGSPTCALQELPAIGARELLHGAQHGILRAPLVLWTEGSETYHDYVMRGVLRAAKLD
jgi:hypothetical protein